MKKSDMRKAYDKAIIQYNKAECALQIFASSIVFKGFDKYEPRIGFVNEDCIILTYNYSEIDGEEAIKIMESKGCITPDDF